MVVITGATGQLGQLVIQKLLKSIPASQIIAAVRHPEKAAGLATQGIQVRQADYDHPETLRTAFHGADKVLLISSSEVGQRVSQHRAVIDAAKTEGVSLLAYTSILHADHSPLPLAKEHIETERLIAASGVPAVLLRNGWYSENYLAGASTAVQHGTLLGSAGEGRISSAAREDYAEAAAVVLTLDDQAGKVYELAGDSAYTLTELAAAISRAAGKTVVYQDLPEAEYQATLVSVGLPEGLAALLVGSDAGAAKGGLFDDSHQLSQLIGRPTTPVDQQLPAFIASI